MDRGRAYACRPTPPDERHSHERRPRGESLSPAHSPLSLPRSPAAGEFAASQPEPFFLMIAAAARKSVESPRRHGDTEGERTGDEGKGGSNETSGKPVDA